MRTFHIGGAASRAAVASSVDAKSDGLSLQRHDALRDQRQGATVVISRSGEISSPTSTAASGGASQGALWRDPEHQGRPVSQGRRRAGQLGPADAPDHHRVRRKAKFENVEEGLTVAKQLDEVTGLSTLVVIDSKRRGALKVVRHSQAAGRAGNEVKIPGTDHSVTIGFPVGSLIQIRDGQDLGTGEVLARIRSKARRRATSPAVCPAVPNCSRRARPGQGHAGRDDRHGVVRQGDQGQGSPADHRPGRQGLRRTRAEGKDILVHEGQVVNKGESIVDGPADRRTFLRLLGIEELARYIVDEVQDVYVCRV